MSVKLSSCLLLLLFLWPFQEAVAAAENPGEEPAEFETLVVIASKIARPLADVAGTVQLIDAIEIEKISARNMDDMLRYQPGITVERAGTRFGTEGINIRGIGGNRVAMEIDGVPVQSQFSLGSFSNTGRDTLEVETIKRVEILSGPASTLYGSRAIGGVMAVTTVDPRDLVADRGPGGRLKTAWYSVDQSLALSAGAAWQNDETGWLAFYTRREGQQPENRAADGFAADLQDWDSDSLLSKFVWDSPAGNSLRLIYNGKREAVSTDVRAVLGLGRFAATSRLRGEDRANSDGLSADYRFSTAWLDDGLLRVFYNQADIRQFSFETRPVGRRPAQIDRQFYFNEQITGLEVNAFKRVVIGDWIHNLGFGLEYQENRVRERRDATSTSLISGEVSKVILGERFPTRDFPLSRSRETGLFLHDEIELGLSGWRLIPGIRFDDYQLLPRRDGIFDINNEAVAIRQISDSGFSPKLGALYALSEQWNLFAQYARGFRAPPSQDVNRSLYLPVFKFRVLPNPGLRSETSDGLELGIRRSAFAGSFSASAFWTEYDDFIESAALLGFDPASGELRFQSRNITRARIYGLEFHWQQPLESLLPGLSLQAAGYWSRGENLDSGQPLNSVSPPQLVTGLDWQSADRRFSLAAVTTLSAAQTRIDETVAERFATPAYAIVDLNASWQIHPRVRLQAGLFNLFDKKYWRWADVSRIAPDDPLIETLSRPGRNFSISLKIAL